MHELEHFIKLSKFAGERFDLVQAGGGNSSVKKSDGTMLIKASGYLLSEVSEKSGYAVVDNRKLLEIMEDASLLSLKDKKQLENISKEMVDKTIVSSTARPSIETLLHALLHKYVLHTHPVTVNAITCRSNWKEVLTKLFPESAFVDYFTPGVELALGMKKQLKIYQGKHKKLPAIIFLQNHGIIIGSENAEEIYELYDQVVKSISEFLGIDLSKYQLTNKLSSLVNSVDSGQRIAYLSEDRTLYGFLEKKRALLFTAPFCPDTFVFCGISSLELANLDDAEVLKEFQAKYHDLPKVLIYKEHLFFLAPNLKKAREIEDVYKFHLYVADAAKGDIQFLPDAELRYLGNWEAEKYRQKL